MIEDNDKPERPDEAYEEVIREDVGLENSVDDAMWGWLDDDKLLSKTLDYRTIAADDPGGGPTARPYPTTDEAKRRRAVRNRYLNSEGDFFRKVNFDGVTDEGLVWMVADEFDGIPIVPRRAASAELDRRHAAAMRSSSRTSHRLAVVMYIVVLVQVGLLIYQIWGPSSDPSGTENSHLQEIPSVETTTVSTGY